MKPLCLLSVSDKTGLLPFAEGLARLGFRLLSTGGTAKALRDAGLDVEEVASWTGSPEVLGGRVKTLHPKIFAGILARLHDPEHPKQMQELGFEPINMVVVNLYPFPQVVSKPDVTVEQAIENIDIGGPSLIRAAAKNHERVTVVVDTHDYPKVLVELERNGQVSPALRQELAVKAFQHTAVYDACIAAHLPHLLGTPNLPTWEALYSWLEGHVETLRYGENPHQRAFFLRPKQPQGLAGFVKLQGKELSYNNIMDADAAWRAVWDLPSPGVVIVKHASPCGAALGATASEAYRSAFACDPISAFGGVIAFSLPVDEGAAAAVNEQFAEVVLAPAYTPEAEALLAKKKNLRVLKAPRPQMGLPRLRVVDGGLLVQEPDEGFPEKFQVVTRRFPSLEEKRAGELAWRVAKHTISNACVVAQEGQTLGIGGGQPSRVDACRLAVERAASFGHNLTGAAAASDGFFPFPDGLKVLAEAGITFVVQPGGSVRDSDVIAAADEMGIAMAFTGRRHFRH
ncbi:MAG: bifunctional phosphoribosylaminoimidazolecarboxamide formyltransferase/IMP cyclohydrolase [Thermoanaerobaculaceae bacterium]